MIAYYAAAWLWITSWNGSMVAMAMPSMEFCQQEERQVHGFYATKCIAGIDTRDFGGKQ